jgi:fructokinase
VKKEQFFFTEGKFYEHQGFEVEVTDTIGSGDSFLAALLKGILEKNKPSESLKFACAMGSLVATHQGATPFISEEEVNGILAENSLKV